MEEEELTTKAFHCIWLYDLFVEADRVEEEYLNIQYQEIGIDVENPPEFTFWSEQSDTMENMFWGFGTIIGYAFPELPFDETMDYEYIPIE